MDDKNLLVGIVTNRDLRFERDLERLVDEVMTKDNLVTTSQSTDLQQAADILQRHKIEKLPVVDKDGHLVGLVTYKDITKAKDKPFACKDKLARNTLQYCIWRGTSSIDCGVAYRADGQMPDIAYLLQKWHLPVTRHC